MTTRPQRNATKKYISKQLSNGWKWMTVLVPSDVKDKLMKYKWKLMEEYRKK